MSADAGTKLLRAVREALGSETFGTFQRLESTAWASITFTGARHEIEMLLAGEDAEAAADRFTAALDATEFVLRGHIVAEILVAEREQVTEGVRLKIEALTVEDG